jgi:hypothetical protein
MASRQDSGACRVSIWSSEHGTTVDLMEDAFEKIACDGEMLLNEEYQNIFQPIVNQVELFAEYLEFIFEKKVAHALGSQDNNDNWLLFDELCAESFFPSCSMYVNTFYCLLLGRSCCGYILYQI